MKTMRSLPLAALAAISLAAAPAGLASPGAHGPNGEHLDAPGSATPTSGLGRLPDGSVNIPMLAQRRLGIRTQIISKSSAAASVRLPGYVIIDPDAGGYVQAAIGGRIRPGPAGFPVNGQAVKEGDILAYVEQFGDPYDAVNQRALLAEIRSSRELAEKELRRVQALRGTVSARQIDEARERLTSLKAREAEISQGIGAIEELRAPVSGVVAGTSAVNGKVVDPRDLLFEIIDPARLHIEAVTADATLIDNIAQASLDDVAGVSLRLLGAGRSLRDGVLPLTFAVTASGGSGIVPLAVGQPVTVIAQTKQTVEGFVVPAAAIVRSPANEPIVWIKSGAERYIPQPVQFQQLDAATVVVTAGLGDDNRVVIAGASLIAQIR